MKKTYIAPYAEVMLLVPNENIATWKTEGFFWSSEGLEVKAPPASGTTRWWEFDTEEINPINP